MTLVLCGCQSAKVGADDLAQGDRSLSEKHRPQYHFTPPSQWMNDPNGMVYYEGEYHLFYQHYPDSNVWGPMHWGHAVSHDMVNWEHLPIAIYPDSLGLIFSGSAVIDWNNTSGFGDGKTPPMIAIFTHHLIEGEKEGRDDFQYQSIAYSLDKGRTFTMYKGNPVIPNPGIRDFRDPKVIWHEETERWVMVFSARDRVKFYTSPDLKNWEFASDFGSGQGSPGRPWECPDIFPMVAEDGITKWVLIVSVQSDAPNQGTGTSYFIGDFDGKVFTNEDDPQNINWLDYGADNYAFVTWSDIPEKDGRRLGIGWMSNWMYAQVVPTNAWRSAMTLPRELRLVRRNGAYRIHSTPVSELTELEIEMNEDLSNLDSTFVLRANVHEDFSLNILNPLNESYQISYTDNLLTFDRSKSGVVDFHPDFGKEHKVDLQGLVLHSIEVYVDLSSIEIFLNDGELAITEIVFPNQPYNQIKYENLENLSVNAIKTMQH